MQDGRKAVWSIPYVSVAFFPSLKQNFIVYRSSKVSDCIFEIHQLWQSGFSRLYSISCYRCSFEPKIIKISQSSHKMYNNSIRNFQESTTILNACTKIVRKLIECTTYYKPGQLRYEDFHSLDDLNETVLLFTSLFSGVSLTTEWHYRKMTMHTWAVRPPSD